MATTYVRGVDAGLYYGAKDVTSPSSMTEITNVRDVTLSLESADADITTRANSGWRNTISTLRECTVEFQLLWLPGDSAFETIRNAFLAGTEIALAVLDQKRTVQGSLGPVGNFAITKFSRNEGLEDAVTFVSGVSDERIVELYSEAEAAVVPSLYEGFSLPAI